MRPTRRKAAALERVRLANEEAFWEFMDCIKETALAIIKLPEKERRTETRRICAQAIKVAIQHKLVEPVAQGMARDAYQSVSSFIELSAGGQNASWPKRNAGQTTIYEEALDEYAGANLIAHLMNETKPYRPTLPSALRSSCTTHLPTNRKTAASWRSW